MHATFNNYLWTCKIDISAYTEPETHFITLREPNIAEVKELVKLQKLIDDDKAEDYEINVIDAIDRFCGICCTLIINHDFYEDPGKDTKKQGAKEVVEFMRSKIDLAQEVLASYMAELPLLKASKKK